MESTPFRDDPLPSYLENTKSTAYRWNHDLTDSTAHPSVGDNTTRDLNTKDDEAARADRVKQLASLLDDLDASAKSSRIRTTDLFGGDHSGTLSPPDSPSVRDSLYTQSQLSTAPSQPPQSHKPSTSRRDLSDIHEHSQDDEEEGEEDEEEMLSDLDEMINHIPSEEEADPRMSPAALTQSTPFHNRDSARSKNRSLAREVFSRGDVSPLRHDDISPVRGLKSAQKTPATAKTPAKQVDFKDPSAPRFPSKGGLKTPGYVAPSPIERRPSSPRKFSNNTLPPEQQRAPSPTTPSPPTDPALQHLTAQITQMQNDIRKRDTLIQDLVKNLQSPEQQSVQKELANAKREIEMLRESQNELKKGQEDILAMSTPERTMGAAGLGGRTREKIGKWQEFLETPISVSQRRSRRDTPRQQSRILDEEDLFPTRSKPPASPRAAPPSPRVEQREKDPLSPADELAKLKDQLAKAESQIQQLKLEKLVGKGPGEGHELHAKPLGPNMMPDAKNAKLARDEKMYYRLGLYKIDRLCSNETANLLKNVLIQLDCPLDQIVFEITHLSQKMNEYNLLQEFALGVHERIYNGEKMEVSEGEGVDVECLREMLVRVGKLASRRR